MLEPDSTTLKPEICGVAELKTTSAVLGSFSEVTVAAAIGKGYSIDKNPVNDTTAKANSLLIVIKHPPNRY
ncbi:MAG: hypothetical protein SOX82_04010 [Eubacteriales bacterium]|nr:hypothetical protein [Eubacteriales bacterium]